MSRPTAPPAAGCGRSGGGNSTDQTAKITADSTNASSRRFSIASPGATVGARSGRSRTSDSAGEPLRHVVDTAYVVTLELAPRRVRHSRRALITTSTSNPAKPLGCGPEELTQTPLAARPNHCVADPARGGDSQIAGRLHPAPAVRAQTPPCTDRQPGCRTHTLVELDPSTQTRALRGSRGRRSDGKSLAALPAPSTQYLPPSLRAHPNAEAVGLLPSPVVRLKCPFHRILTVH